MIKDRLEKFFKNVHFVYLATCDKSCRPNAAPKFLLKIEGDSIYLADYVFGKTWSNLQENPIASATISDYESLIGYQLNGTAVILNSGKEYEKLKKEFQVKKVKSSVERIIKSVREGKAGSNFELIFPDKTGIIVLTVNEIVDINPTGILTRDK